MLCTPACCHYTDMSYTWTAWSHPYGLSYTQQIMFERNKNIRKFGDVATTFSSSWQVSTMVCGNSIYPLKVRYVLAEVEGRQGVSSNRYSRVEAEIVSSAK